MNELTDEQRNELEKESYCKYAIFYGGPNSGCKPVNELGYPWRPWIIPIELCNTVYEAESAVYYYIIHSGRQEECDGYEDSDPRKLRFEIDDWEWCECQSAFYVEYRYYYLDDRTDEESKKMDAERIYIVPFHPYEVKSDPHYTDPYLMKNVH